MTFACKTPSPNDTDRAIRPPDSVYLVGIAQQIYQDLSNTLTVAPT
jgi:hypothetical protein